MNDQDSLISHQKSSIELTDRSLDSVTVTEVKKRHVGSVRTGFTVFKAFFASAILFMPYQFLISGWLFTTIAFVILCAVNIQSVKLLSEVHDVTGGSFPQMAERVYGKKMKLLSEVLLMLNQISLNVTYIYFIASQIGGENGVLKCATSVGLSSEDCMGGFTTNRWWWVPISMIILVPLVLVR